MSETEGGADDPVDNLVTDASFEAFLSQPATKGDLLLAFEQMLLLRTQLALLGVAIKRGNDDNFVAMIDQLLDRKSDGVRKAIRGIFEEAKRHAG